MGMHYRVREATTSSSLSPTVWEHPNTQSSPHPAQCRWYQLNTTSRALSGYRSQSAIPNPWYTTFHLWYESEQSGQRSVVVERQESIGIRRLYVRKGVCTWRRIRGLLFSLCSLFWLSIRHSRSSFFSLVYTEYQSDVFLFFIGFKVLSPDLCVLIKVFGSRSVIESTLYQTILLKWHWPIHLPWTPNWRWLHSSPVESNY